MELNGFYFGTIEEVYPPDHKMNSCKLQYEYKVLITCDNFAQIPVRCIRIDPFGGFYNYCDAILAKGYRVFVQFPQGDRSLGVIVGGSRFNSTPTDSKVGIVHEQRFNEIIETHDFKGAWMLRSTDGPFIKLEKTKISITDTPIKQYGYQNENYQKTNNSAQSIDASNFDGQFIVLNKSTNELFINTNKFRVVVNQNAEVHIKKDSNVKIDGAATITILKDANINVSGTANVTTGKDMIANVKGELKAKVGKNATIESSGKAKVKAKEIQLQSDGATFPMSEILTTGSEMVTDYITGIPTIGLNTIKAGT